MGRAGAWVPVLPQLDPEGGGGAAPTGPQDVRRNLADRLAVAEAGLLRFGGVKFGSSLERDVALVLTGARLRFEVQQPYTSFVTTERAWTADFVVTVGGVKVVVEATGRADAAATVDEKVKVLDGSKVPYVVVRGHGDLDGLVQKVVERAKAAATARARAEPATVPDPQKPHVTAGGVYVDPRAVRRPGYVPTPAPLVHRDPLPPLPAPPPIPGLELADHELRRLEELQEAEDDRYLQERLSAARAQARADLAQLRASETPEQKKERAAGLLRADREKWRAAAEAERRQRAAERQRDQAEAEAAAYQLDDGEHELTGEESAEEDELPDDTEAGRSE